MIDLHIHTNISDGRDSAREVLQHAEELSLSVISITDHNKTLAYDEIAQNRSLFSGRIVPGIEISCIFQGFSIELLGYGIDPVLCRRELDRNFHPEDYRKRERLIALETIAKTGFRYDRDRFEERAAISGVKKAMFLEYQAFEEENRNLLSDEKNGASFVAFFRGELYRPGNPLSLDYASYQPSAEEAKEIIRCSGGYAFFAHPFVSFPEDRDMIERIAESGIDGIECFYPGFSQEERGFLLSLCEKYRLFHSAGSDYHGKSRPNQLGTGNNDLSVSEDFISGWIKKVKTI